MATQGPTPPPIPGAVPKFKKPDGSPGRPSNAARAAAAASAKPSAAAGGAPASGAAAGAKPAASDPIVAGQDVADDLGLLFNDYAASGLGDHWKVPEDKLKRLGARGAGVLNKLSATVRNVAIWFNGIMFVLHVLALLAVRLWITLVKRKEIREAKARAARGQGAQPGDVTHLRPKVTGAP